MIPFKMFKISNPRHFFDDFLKNRLTVSISCNDRIRLKWNSRAVLIDSSNPEDVLIVLDQSAAHA